MFFALGRAALRHFSRSRLEEALQRRNRLRDLKRLFRRHDELVRATGLLYALALIAMAVLLHAWGREQFADPAVGTAAGVALAVVLALTVGGMIPMAWARYAADGVLVVTLPVLFLCRTAFLPVQRALRLLDALVRRLAGVPRDALPESPIEEEIRSVVSEGQREGAIAPDQREMIESVIEFRKADVSEAMTPRTDIVSIEADATAEEATQLVAQEGHSRIPVVEGRVDSVVGILYAKDLLINTRAADDARTRVRDLMRPALFVPETKHLDELLREFRRAKVHMAVVLDEYGGTAGLVTIEDIIEEIFGEIVDEYEEVPPQPIRRLEDGGYEVEARVHIDEINDELSLDLPEDEDFDTIGGYVLSCLGHIPKSGETLERDGARITVLEAEPRRINRLKIEPAPGDEAAGEA
jgi:CBS domain containing-hemolysin-like protein